MNIVSPIFFQKTSKTVKVKIKFTLEQATKAQRGSSYSSTYSLTSALDGGGWSTASPGTLYPQKREPVPIV
jgi:hypothetical protein